MIGAWEFWVRLEILGWNPVAVRVCVWHPVGMILKAIHSVRGASIRLLGTRRCTATRAPRPTMTRSPSSGGSVREGMDGTGAVVLDIWAVSRGD